MMINTGLMILPSSIHAVPAKGLLNEIVQPPRIISHLKASSKDERLRAYHARIDLMHAMINRAFLGYG